MAKIEIDTFFGNKPIHVEISAPMGGAGVNHVSIDNFYNGQIVKTEHFAWGIYLHDDTILQGDDVSVIIELIEKNLITE